MLATPTTIGLVFGVTIVTLRLSQRLGSTAPRWDKRSVRNVHTTPIPRVGGIGIVLGVLASLPILMVFHRDLSWILGRDTHQYVGVVAAAFLLFVVGLTDDLRGVSPRWKLLFQVLAAELVIISGTVIERLDLGPLGELSLGYAATPFTLVFIVGLVNAMNLIDGLDGLAGGLAFIALSVSTLLIARHGDLDLARGLFFVMLALLAFLAFNFHPATVFLGDAGSLTIGLITAVALIHAFTTPNGAVAAPSFLLPVLAPALDTLLSMARRFIIGMGLFQPDRDHIHHRFLVKMKSQTKAVLALWAVAAAQAVAAVLLVQTKPALLALGLLAAFGATAYLLYASDNHRLLDPRHVRNKLREHRMKNKALRAIIHELLDGIEEHKALWEIKHHLANVASLMGCSCFHIQYDGPDGKASFSWARADFIRTNGANTVKDRFPIRFKGKTVGRINIGWPKGKVLELFDKRLLAEQLADGVTTRFPALQMHRR